MKRLTAIRLVNWHYFRNETLRLAGSTLLTGDNGSGKSTVLDAIQYALVGDARKVRFNSSAHDETRRSLEGYLRCRTGVEQSDGGAGLLRSGDFTTYIVLEFHDTRRRQPFLLGCGIDSFAAGDHDPPLFFKLEGQALDEALFFEGARPRSARRELRPLLQNRKGATVYASAEQYRADVLTKLGHLSPRFFDLLVKAIAFHPITDIRRFVYDYVLDARAINVEVMRENLLQYRQYEALVAQAQAKVEALRKIAAAFAEWRQWEETVSIQDYLILRARREAAAAEQRQLSEVAEALRMEAALAAAALAELNGQKEGVSQRWQLLQGKLAGDPGFQLAQRLQAEVRRLEADAAEAGHAARPLCELIEVADEHWQNAVEGYLNTQRFDLFVAPEAFDPGLAVYEQRKREFRLHSVGLVNSAAALAGDPGARPGSLAEVVQTENPYARAYINRLLGRVQRCASEQELKGYPLAITATCMTYRNHTARQIPFEVYAVWYVGERAFARQRELKQARLAELAALSQAIEAQLAAAEVVQQRLKDKATLYEQVLAVAWREATALPELQAALAAQQQELAALDLSGVAELERQVAAAAAELAALEQRAEEQRNRRSECEARARVKAEEAAARGSDHAALDEQLRAFAAERPAIAQQGAVRYQEERRARGDQEIATRFAANRSTNLTRVGNLKIALEDLRARYNQDYQFGGPVREASNAAYDAELLKLEESELPAYAQRIAAAREAAEQEFKEHFIYKLQEYIVTARDQFRHLNSVLERIPFGQDRYGFAVGAAPSHKALYDMIMDPLAVEGPSLFAGAFREKYRGTLDQLFAAILDPDGEQQARNIEEFTDYRTYLDFDIRIHHASGESTLFSRVLREKSGGETQTPFYVAMVASFLQLYGRDNAESARLMLFDEAFNRMDPDRAEHTLQFIRQLGLQVLAAAPTDKCEIIAPHVETTLLVMRSGDQTWVEDYHQVLADDPLAEAEAAATGEQP